MFHIRIDYRDGLVSFSYHKPDSKPTN